MGQILFLEQNLKVDASNLNIGGVTNNTISIPLTKDLRNVFTNETFTVTIKNQSGIVISDTSLLPFTATISTVSSNKSYLLNLVFSKPVANVNFGYNRTLVISNGVDVSLNLFVEINYSSPYSVGSWSGNSEDTDLLSEIPYHDSVVSNNANLRFRGLLQGIVNTTNKIKTLFSRYSYQSYLPDIIDFAIGAGCGSENHTAIVNRDSQTGDVISIIKDFGANTRRSKVKFTYTYNASLARTRYSTSSYSSSSGTTFESGLTSIKMELLDSSNNIIVVIGTITFTRSITKFSVPTGISGYQYYEFPMITSYSVVL